MEIYIYESYTTRRDDDEFSCSFFDEQFSKNSKTRKPQAETFRRKIVVINNHLGISIGNNHLLDDKYVKVILEVSQCVICSTELEISSKWHTNKNKNFCQCDDDLHLQSYSRDHGPHICIPTTYSIYLNFVCILNLYSKFRQMEMEGFILTDSENGNWIYRQWYK